MQAPKMSGLYRKSRHNYGGEPLGKVRFATQEMKEGPFENLSTYKNIDGILGNIPIYNRNITENLFISFTNSIKWSKRWEAFFIEHVDTFINEGYPKIDDENERKHIFCFLRKVYVYKRYSQDYLEVIRRCLCEGPAYADWCKKKLAYGFLNKFNYMDDESVMEWGVLDKYSDVFPHRHLVHWTEDDPEDYKYMKEALPVDREELTFFKSCLQDLIKEIKVKPIPSLFIKAEGGTSVIDEEEHFRGYKKITSHEVSFSHIMEGYRTVIPVEPASYRDSFVLKESSLNTISLISLLTRQIVSKLEASAMRPGQGAHIRETIAGRKLEKFKFCYVRDFTKSGLTMNHEILRTTVETLNEAFPGVGFEYGDILYNHCIRLKKDKSSEYLTIRRGHGLGMANEITTLIQCTIDLMNRVEKPGLADLIHTDCYNDDFRAIGPASYLVQYMIIDEIRCNKLGLCLKKQKTRVLENASLFLEEYATLDMSYNKDILQIMTIQNAYYAYNIYHAKTLIRPLVYSFWAESNEEALIEVRSLIEYWGCEFYPEEIQFASEMGGWIDLPYFGSYQAMRGSYLEAALPYKNLKGVRAESFQEPITFHRGYNPKKYGLSNLNYVKMDEITRLLCQFCDILAWNQKGIADQVWKGLSQKFNESTYWHKMLVGRRELYKREIEFPPTVVDIFNEIVKNNPRKTYIIPPFLIEGKDNCLLEEYDLENFRLPDVIKELDPDRGLRLEKQWIEHHIFGALPLSKDEMIELLLQSDFIYGSAQGFTSCRNDCKCEQIRRYDICTTIRNAAYLARDGALPERIHPEIKLPDRLSLLGVDEETFDLIKHLERFSSVFDNEELEKLERAIFEQELSRIETYAIGHALKTTCPKEEMFHIRPEKEGYDIFEIGWLDDNDNVIDEKTFTYEINKNSEVTVSKQELLSYLVPTNLDDIELDETSDSEQAPLYNEPVTYNSPDDQEILDDLDFFSSYQPELYVGPEETLGGDDET
jgi:hypothetical protein